MVHQFKYFISLEATKTSFILKKIEENWLLFQTEIIFVPTSASSGASEEEWFASLGHDEYPVGQLETEAAVILE